MRSHYSFVQASWTRKISSENLILFWFSTGQTKMDREFIAFFSCWFSMVCLSVRLSHWWFAGTTVKTLDLRSKVHKFDSRHGCYQAITTWMGDCLLTGKPSQYITNATVNLAFHFSRVGKSSTSLCGWGYSGARSWGTFTCVGWQVTLWSVIYFLNRKNLCEGPYIFTYSCIFLLSY